jgi:hypothetical protein
VSSTPAACARGRRRRPRPRPRLHHGLQEHALHALHTRGQGHHAASGGLGLLGAVQCDIGGDLERAPRGVQRLLWAACDQVGIGLALKSRGFGRPPPGRMFDSRMRSVSRLGTLAQRSARAAPAMAANARLDSTVRTNAMVRIGLDPLLSGIAAYCGEELAHLALAAQARKRRLEALSPGSGAWPRAASSSSYTPRHSARRAGPPQGTDPPPRPAAPLPPSRARRVERVVMKGVACRLGKLRPPRSISGPPSRTRPPCRGSRQGCWPARRILHPASQRRRVAATASSGAPRRDQGVDQRHAWARPGRLHLHGAAGSRQPLLRGGPEQGKRRPCPLGPRVIGPKPLASSKDAIASSSRPRWARQTPRTDQGATSEGASSTARSPSSAQVSKSPACLSINIDSTAPGDPQGRSPRPGRARLERPRGRLGRTG